MGTTTYQCANADATKCKYEQLSTGAFPAITALSKTSATVLKATGTNFFTTDYDAVVSVAGVSASSVTISSGTELVATFDKGLPPFTGSVKPVIQFVKKTGSEKHTASGSSTIDNLLAISGKTTGLECSYAGGCLFSVQAPGLASLLAADPAKNYIEVCSKRCEY